ncbi:MAG: RNA polymerase sigma factor [Gammaproteobacteria bacterium]|nr:RNA polymerase sigma factor [Gammaproteobacteria bacterium]
MTVPVGQKISDSRKNVSPNESEIALLAERAQAGNRFSFERLMDMFQGDIFRLVYYRTGSHMDAEDLTQDVFIKAFKGLSGLKDVYRFRPWLFSIAVNRVRDFRRKKKLLFFLKNSEEEMDEWDKADREGYDNHEAFNHLVRKEFWENMGRFTNKLSRWEREVFHLRFLDQLGIKEIAMVLSKSESTIKTHLYRALHKFKETPELNSVLQGENQ